MAKRLRSLKQVQADALAIAGRIEKRGPKLGPQVRTKQLLHILEPLIAGCEELLARVAALEATVSSSPGGRARRRRP